jgi:uncharacterized protein
MPTFATIGLALILLCLPATGEQMQDPYSTEMALWRQRRLASLTAPDGFLTLAGLFWLQEGDSRFGSAADADLVFPDSVPANVGIFHLTDGHVSVTIDPAAEVLRRGPDGVDEGAGVVTFPSLTEEDPEPLRLGRFSFYPIERSGRFAVRLQDADSPTLRDFHGLTSYPVDPAWRIEGTLERFDKPRDLALPTVIGTPAATTYPGVARFEVGGEEYRLIVLGDPDGPSLFAIFGDQTNDSATYGSGRFLSVENLGDGRLVLDFNKAYNPPCAFTPFATCPLPPPGNHLPLGIAAGEKRYGDH